MPLVYRVNKRNLVRIGKYFGIGRKYDDTIVLVNKLSKTYPKRFPWQPKVVGGYVVVYITPTFFYSGQSLSDGKDQWFSAKVWNFGTTFLNS